MAKEKNKITEIEVEEINKDEEIIVTEKVKNNSKVKKFIKELIPYVIILIVVMLIRTYLFTPIMVSGPSMQPTLDGGELMILNKRGTFDRFDVVVVDIGYEDIIKRIIAMPGETISCENGIVYVNGRKQEESYSKGITSDFEKIKLRDDEYFVMGDNRQNSKDSRHVDVGPIKEMNMKGTTKLVLFPFNKIGNIE